MRPSRLKVLSMVGSARSGTTILGNILGEVQGVANAGELRWLWRWGLAERRPCGCGLPPVECPRWSVVLSDLRRARLPAADDAAVTAAIDAASRAQAEVLARRNRLRAISAATGRDTRWAALRCARAATVDVCAALAQASGAGLVVDTSKLAQQAALLAGAPEVDHYVLHLVRDPRAVAFSWQRRKALPLADGISTMATMGPVASVRNWSKACVQAEMLRHYVPGDRWLSVRYEDFVARPEATVSRVLDFVRVAPPAPFLGPDTVRLGLNHTLAGNPNRFRTGSVRIAEDDEWKVRLARRDRVVITAGALPLLLRYGYPVRPDR
jgi:Sulfotransferase family